MPPRSAIGASILLLALLPAQEGGAARTRFTSQNHTFLIDLPADFRQLAPNEAARLRADPATPDDWRRTEPHTFYAVGPVDRWLHGDVATPWLYVVEQEAEWIVGGDFATAIAERWRGHGAGQGLRHLVEDVRQVTVGPQAQRVWRAVRTTAGAGRAIKSLDVYAATGGRQVTLTLRAWAEDFARWQPQFEQWLTTLTFARRSRGEQSLADRLWTPALGGAFVGLVLLALYRHSRRHR
jgi:hypothetical protein